MGDTKIAKQYMELAGKPIIYYSLKAFVDSDIDEIVLVCGAGDERYVADLVDSFSFDKHIKIATGGAQRYHSVYAGLCEIENADRVLIHDGARPFVDEEIIGRLKNELESYDAVVAAVRTKDTIKIADENGIVVTTPNRNSLWNMQTPQCFRFDMIKEAYRRLIETEEDVVSKGINITDDAMVLELFSDTTIKLCEGSYENIKITTPEDLSYAQMLIDSRQY